MQIAGHPRRREDGIMAAKSEMALSVTALNPACGAARVTNLPADSRAAFTAQVYTWFFWSIGIAVACSALFAIPSVTAAARPYSPLRLGIYMVSGSVMSAV